MSLIHPVELFLINLEEKVSYQYPFIYMDMTLALSELKKLTGQDFGYDAKLWRKWLLENGFLNPHE
jgi:hypothetical protein